MLTNHLKPAEKALDRYLSLLTRDDRIHGTAIKTYNPQRILRYQIFTSKLASMSTQHILRLFSSLVGFLIIGTGHHRELKADEPSILKVFLLAGQSNMEGQGVVDLDHPQYYNGGLGTVKWLLKQDATKERYRHLVDENENWQPRNDVWCRFKTREGIKKGPLDIGFAGYGGRHHIGPELQFGHVLGDAMNTPILIIKTAWGGKSLFTDFRPPSAGGTVGPYYLQMMKEYHEAIDQIPTEFPHLKNLKPELAGFVWFQGWNDAFGPEEARQEYQVNLRHLINDVRREFKVPRLPVVIGELGNEGARASQSVKDIRTAQRAVCCGPDAPMPIAFAETAEFARPAEKSPNVTHGHHWYGNAESYLLIGESLGLKMRELLDH